MEKSIEELHLLNVFTKSDDSSVLKFNIDIVLSVEGVRETIVCRFIVVAIAFFDGYTTACSPCFFI